MLGALVVARALEEGRLRGPVARALTQVWAQVASRGIVRPVPRPDHVALVAVGGATLGGSGKTPVAIACARWLAQAGRRVALVGHAYGARPGHARVVLAGDALDDVGDEALVAVAALQGRPGLPGGTARVPVVVGPSRAAAVALASTLADVVVVDGVLQTRPRATLSLLAVDARLPWGEAQSVPPCGDLRAPVAALLHEADQVVRVGEQECDARTVSRGAWVAGELLPWDALARLRVGLLVALARPARILSMLERRGVVPRLVLRAPDHGRFSPGQLAGARRARASQAVDLWLATPKCALHARPALDRVLPGQVLGILDHTVALGPDVTRALARLDPANPGQ